MITKKTFTKQQIDRAIKIIRESEDLDGVQDVQFDQRFPMIVRIAAFNKLADKP